MRPACSLKNKFQGLLSFQLPCPDIFEQMAQIFTKMALNGNACRRQRKMTDKISDSTVRNG